MNENETWYYAPRNNGLEPTGEYRSSGSLGLHYPEYESPEIELGLVFYRDHYPCPNIIYDDNHDDDWGFGVPDPQPDDQFLILNPCSGSDPRTWWQRREIEKQFESGQFYLNPHNQAEFSNREPEDLDEYSSWWVPILERDLDEYSDGKVSLDDLPEIRNRSIVFSEIDSELTFLERAKDRLRSFL
jgi:hypothetical protein